MPSVVALLASLLFTAYLDVRARKSCPLPSGSAWIAVIWILQRAFELSLFSR